MKKTAFYAVFSILNASFSRFFHSLSTVSDTGTINNTDSIFHGVWSFKIRLRINLFKRAFRHKLIS
ncbi:MAG: hypothetical protein A2939_01605 [Parcubacteria group bacterium RIFCSPLOWO2_01_FULL_48_18]|nr:MAG: hypothetical protein A2939_01605 [Parcubacteria group bacterium RIFCSPLOWO2_01_FULL_48_18]OHB23605.1 MAG: hypothetical protein A3J67_01995 [Parcubacteria group bacterium RIFCSPHIGHO2_02_FULL_48_10b]